MPLGLLFHSAAQQRAGPSGRGIQRGRQTVPAEIPVAGVYLRAQFKRRYSHNGPGLLRHLLCRSDWLPLRGISETECLILPSRELAAIPRCSMCEPRLDSSPAPQYDSDLGLGSPEALIPETKNPARKTNRFYQGCCYRQLSLCTAHTEGSFPTGQACRRIFWADQTGFACREFQRQDARSS